MSAGMLVLGLCLATASANCTDGPGPSVQNGLYSDDRELSRQDLATAAAILIRPDRSLPMPEMPLSYRWLGHTRLLTEDIPGAIVAYRRGLELDPSDDKLHRALNYARDQVAYLSPDHRPAENLWPYWLSIRRFPWLTFAAYSLGWLALTRWWMIRWRGWLIAAALGFAITAVPAIGTAIEWRDRARDEVTPVVVLKSDTVLRSGNGADYAPRFDAPLPRGQEMQRIFDKGGWFQVELPNGVVGWVPRESCVLELTDASHSSVRDASQKR